MKRWQILVFFSALGSLIVLMSGFSGKARQEAPLQSLDIAIGDREKLRFVDESTLRILVQKTYPDIFKKKLSEINIALLEENLEIHASIKNAEVYSTLAGTLNIDVKQKQPVVRFNGSTSGYYLDQYGQKMPLSSSFTAEVPLVTGAVRGREKEVCTFFQQLEKHPYFQSWFAGMHIDAQNNWILFPVEGKHKVILGEPEEIEVKLQKLEAFYKSVINAKNIDDYKSINLKFQDQVVCKKHHQK